MTVRLYNSILALICATALFAAPANRAWQQRQMTDGTQVTVRLVGDEFSHHWETTNGQWLDLLPDGTFAPTAQAKKCQLATDHAQRVLRSPGQRNLAPRGLVILAQFEDTKFDAANDLLGFYNMLNMKGYDYNGATGSAADYFQAQSNGQYKPVFDVVGPVDLPHEAAYYGTSGTSYGTAFDDIYIADFVIDAVLAAEQKGCDFTQYDADNNGYADIVYIIYAGKGEADGGASTTIWPHNWEISDAFSWGLTHGKTDYSAYNLPVLDGKTINVYACSAELDGEGKRAGIGTFCHEFSHVLGLPDYYVTSKSAANYDKDYTPGAWSIMDYGLYNNDGKTPPNYSAHDKYFMKWLTPKLLAKDAAENVKVTTEYNDVYLINGKDAISAYNANTMVWYLENRQQTGWDEYLPGHGLCVWEVKYNSYNWSNNTPNNSTVGYTLVTADNPVRPYKPCVYQTNVGDESGTPFPGTGDVTSYTPATGCELSNITETLGNIYFLYNGGAAVWTYELLGNHCIYPDGGQVALDAPLSLTIVPEEGYTLAAPDCWNVEMGGETLTYGVDFSYDATTNTFNIPAITGDLVILIDAKKSSTTGISTANYQLSTKFVRDGQIFILRNGKVYSLLGNVCAQMRE